MSDIWQAVLLKFQEDPIKSLADATAAAGFAIASATAILALLAYRQTARSNRLDHLSATADRVTESFRKFQERYISIADERNAIWNKNEPEKGRQVYARSIDLQYNQWEGFLSGIIYVDQYEGMARYLRRDLTGGRNYGGVNSETAWKEWGRPILELNPRIVAFFEALATIDDEDEEVCRRRVKQLVAELDLENRKVRKERAKWASR